MACELTFKQVCELIKKDDPKLIDTVDRLLGIILICSPVVIGPTAAAVLPTLAVKNELMKLGRAVFDSFTKKKDADYLARQQRMQAAYSLLVFTAFFEALDLRIPRVLRDRIGSLNPEKIFLKKGVIGGTSDPMSGPPDVCTTSEARNPLATVGLAFPHPTESLAQQVERHAQLWKQMGLGFQELIQKLAFWEELKEKEQAQMLAATGEIYKAAAECFEAQYFELARRYEDFAIWANLQEHKKTKELIGALSEYVQNYANLSKAGNDSIDIGLARFHETVLSIPETLKVSQATDIVESLRRHYNARVNEPIIEEKEEPEEDKPRLSFPRVCNAFIPQSFRVLRQASKARRFEDEVTWQDLPRRSDLGAFILSYLSSPYSTETPLIILGHPGSGKSLLTTVLSAQLMTNHYTAVRVPLREVDAEAGIVAQIEQRLRQITNLSLDSWAKLSGAV